MKNLSYRIEVILRWNYVWSLNLFKNISCFFLQNSVSKHEYLGEYTGELISHKEADKRGKIYDRENSSFLFNLNDQARLSLSRLCLQN